MVRTWENTVHNKKLTLLFLVQSTRRVSKSARVLGHCSTSLKTPPSEQEFSSIFTRLESDDPQDDHGQSRMIDMVIINRALLKQSIDIDLKHMKKQSRSMDKEWLKKTAVLLGNGCFQSSTGYPFYLIQVIRSKSQREPKART